MVAQRGRESFSADDQPYRNEFARKRLPAWGVQFVLVKANWFDPVLFPSPGVLRLRNPRRLPARSLGLLAKDRQGSQPTSLLACEPENSHPASGEDRVGVQSAKCKVQSAKCKVQSWNGGMVEWWVVGVVLEFRVIRVFRGYLRAFRFCVFCAFCGHSDESEVGERVSRPASGEDLLSHRNGNRHSNKLKVRRKSDKLNTPLPTPSARFPKKYVAGCLAIHKKPTSPEEGSAV